MATAETGEDASSERMAVLRMLEQGKITATEAAELLKALREREEHFAPTDWVEQAARRAAARAQRVAQRGRRRAEDWARHADDIASRTADNAARTAEQIGEHLGRVFANLPDLMERAARAGWGTWGPGFTFDDQVDGELEGDGGPAGLDLEGWNGPVRLYAADGRHVRLQLRKTVHAPTEAEARDVAAAVSATVAGRQVSVRRDQGAPSWPGGLSLEAWLPRNAVWGGVVRTGNGPIEMRELSCKGMRLETSNGRVEVRDCGGEDLTVVTSNGRIEVEGVGGRAELRTSNGTIALGPAGGRDCEVSAVTSNGTIEVRLAEGYAVDIDASTTNGRIDTLGLPSDGPPTQGSGRTELRWRSPNWGEAAARAKLRLRTSNGSIRFR